MPEEEGGNEKRQWKTGIQKGWNYKEQAEKGGGTVRKKAKDQIQINYMDGLK